jgi:TonB family protein
VREDYRHYFRVAILFSILIHLTLLYFGYPDVPKKQLETPKKEFTLIKVHGFPVVRKHDKVVRPKGNSIRPPIPHERIIKEPSITEYVESNKIFSDKDMNYNYGDRFGTAIEGGSPLGTSDYGGDQIGIPDYEDFVFGVLGQNAKEGDRIYYVEPEYPVNDVRSYIQGSMILRITVNPKGKVISVYIMKGVGNVAIEEAAKKAAMKWRYKPVTDNGVPKFFQKDEILTFKLI